MSVKPAEQDNSIEEILASIRQIISEDDPKESLSVAREEVGGAVATEQVSSTISSPSASMSNDDVFELVDRVVADDVPPAPPPPILKTDLLEDREFSLPPEPVSHATNNAPAIPPVVEQAVKPSVFGQAATDATLDAFAGLSAKILLDRQSAVAVGAVTLEQITKELLHPILQQWVEHHVPAIVDRLMREELEKIARQAREG